MHSPVKLRYFPKIDGLRFVAIALVLLEHFADTLGKFITAGYYGVDLFFVISGFLITLILLKPSPDSFKKTYLNFLGRRTLRIFPIYYLSIGVLWLAQLPIVLEALPWLLTYTYNYAWVYYGYGYTPVNHFWSLCVEEQFYLFWPLLVLMLRTRQSLLVGLVILFIILGYGQMVLGLVPFLVKFNNVALFTRIASLSLGALGALYSHRYPLPRAFFSSQVVEYLILVLLLLSLIVNYGANFVVLGLCSLYLVLKAAYFTFSPPLEYLLSHRRVVRIGLISYGIYVYHFPLAYYLDRYVLDPVWIRINFTQLGSLSVISEHAWLLKLPLYSGLTVLLAALSFRYIEIPFLKLKDRYFSN